MKERTWEERGGRKIRKEKRAERGREKGRDKEIRQRREAGRKADGKGRKKKRMKKREEEGGEREMEDVPWGGLGHVGVCLCPCRPRRPTCPLKSL